jgi:putative ABC transport system permease protein
MVSHRLSQRGRIRAPRTGVTPSRLRARDLGGEALAGLLQRPGRAALTALGTVFGIGGFVAIVGLSQTASGQIGKDFNVQDATQVTVADTAAGKASQPTLDFPANADARVDKIHGVVAAGVWWSVNFSKAAVRALPVSDGGSAVGIPVTAASPGALAASGAKLAAGVLFNQFHEDRAQDVAVIGQTAASQLHISNLASQPAIFIGGQPFTVIGILASDPRLPQLNLGVTVPESAALALWGPPTTSNPAQLLIHTRLGAAQVVARQVAVALLVGAVGIANTTLVAVLERSAEIGLRRALGARPRHIAIQFLAESTALGLFGGLVGACAGELAIVADTIYQHWTALIDPRIIIAAPLAGAVIGLLAGLYPALRASSIEPADALRR